MGVTCQEGGDKSEGWVTSMGGDKSEGVTFIGG